MSSPGHPPTPLLTNHARKRCAQYGIPTKVIKRIVRDPDMTRPANSPNRPPGARIARCDEHPEYTVVYNMDGDQPVVITILFEPGVYAAQGRLWEGGHNPKDVGPREYSR